MTDHGDEGARLDHWGALMEAPLAAETLSPSVVPTARIGGGARQKAPWIIAGLAVLAAVLGFVVASAGSSPSQTVIAAAVNLRASDLPGFRLSSGGSGGVTFGGESGSLFRRCWGSDGTGLAGIDSPTFDAGSGLQAESIGSNVAVASSPVAVVSDLALASSARLRSCIAQAWDSVTFTEKGVQGGFSGAQITSLSMPMARAETSVGLRMTAMLDVESVSLPIYVDIYGFGVGRTEATLTTFGVQQPVPVATEQQLSALLVSRAIAQPH
jgi:hypothetical protein